MAEPNDLVQVLKQESTAKGGDSADADSFLGYEQINENDDGLSAAGYYAQETTGTPTRDKTVLLWRSGGEWWAKDQTHTATKLLDLVSVNVGADTDFLLENEPPEPNTDYAITRSAGVVTLEEWTRTGGNLLKDISYTRSSGVVSTIVTRVFAVDGTTVVGQLTETFTRSSGQVVSSTRVRDV